MPTFLIAFSPLMGKNYFLFIHVEEEAKALVLSTGVVEYLQSDADPCSVVAHLQESLELNQGALTDPAPETIRLIRSLAVIAKSEKRLDVVQHLRQITPAGTTGAVYVSVIEKLFCLLLFSSDRFPDLTCFHFILIACQKRPCHSLIPCCLVFLL